MRFTIAHEVSGRMRICCGRWAFSAERATAVAQAVSGIHGVRSARASSITGSIVVTYDAPYRATVLGGIRQLEIEALPAVSGISTQALDIQFERKVMALTAVRLVTRYLLPAPLRAAYTLLRAAPLLKKGIAAVLGGRLNMDALDASAVGVAMATGNMKSAGAILFMLSLSDCLQDYTHRKSKDILADSLAVHVDSVWRATDDGEQLTPMDAVRIGDRLVVRSGAMIPLDGQVVSGEAMVCQASLTGENLPVRRAQGDSVYAGTVVEEGMLVFEVSSLRDDTRINKIISIIDSSEAAKAQLQSRAERMADSIVPLNFLGAAVVFLLTGNLMKGISFLMVDYSCAIKLSTPIAVLSAMREAAERRAFVKGGRYLEALAQADTIVFDKTGTLTQAQPMVCKVVPLTDKSREETLKIAACLEEHFPHSVAAAIVRQAEAENLLHREEHGELEYVVAHGVVAYYGKQRAIIGSRHFVFEDEGIPLTAKNRKIIEKETEGVSAIYLALDGKLLGFITIEDPVRQDAAAVIASLRALGIEHTVMLTGDSESAAGRVAGILGIDTYYAEVLPSEKSELIEKLRSEGHTVIMVGDGINDSPALAKADVGVAMMEGCDLAREVADVVLLSRQLDNLVHLRRLSTRLVGRISTNFKRIIGINTGLIALSLFGVITPGTSALLHNAATFAISAASTRPLLPEPME